MTKQIRNGHTVTTSGTLAAGQTLTAQAGALLVAERHATNNGTIILDGASTPTTPGATLRDIGVLTNAGFISVGGGIYSPHAALLDVVHVLNNTGTIDAAAATGPGGAIGQIRIDATGTLNNSGTLALEDNNNLYQTGLAMLDNGLLTNTAGGTIHIAGTAGVPGDLFITTLAVSGVLQNSGAITLGGFGILGGNGPTGGQTLLLDSGSVANSGVITVEGSGGTVAVTGTLVNQSEIILQAGAPGGGPYYSTPGGLLLDTGLLSNSGTILLEGIYPSAGTGGSITASGVLTNTGTILVQQDGGFTVSGTATNAGSIVLYGSTSSGYFYIYYYPGVGGVLSVTGALTNTGTITLGGGIPIASANRYSSYGGYGATLALAGSMRNEGVLVVAGGDGSLPFYLESTYDVMGRGATISVLGNLFNSKTIDLQHAAASTYGLYGTGAALIDSGFIYNAALITIEGAPGTAAATLTVGPTGTLLSSGTITGTGVLLNQGLITADYTLTIADVAFTNDGTFDDSFATATLTGAVTADAGRTGQFYILDGTLNLDGAVAASQTVLFSDYEHNTLALGDAAAFAGTLSGLASNDIVDFLKLDVVAAATSHDILALRLATGPTLELTLAAPLTGVSLSLHPDGQSGTDLVLTPLPPAT